MLSFSNDFQIWRWSSQDQVYLPFSSSTVVYSCMFFLLCSVLVISCSLTNEMTLNLVSMYIQYSLIMSLQFWAKILHVSFTFSLLVVHLSSLPLPLSSLLSTFPSLFLTPLPSSLPQTSWQWVRQQRNHHKMRQASTALTALPWRPPTSTKTSPSRC